MRTVAAVFVLAAALMATPATAYADCGDPDQPPCTGPVPTVDQVMANMDRLTGRRPLSYEEVQALFDAADGRAEAARKHQRKGVLTALRDAAFLKTVYAFGL